MSMHQYKTPRNKKLVVSIVLLIIIFAGIIGVVLLLKKDGLSNKEQYEKINNSDEMGATESEEPAAESVDESAQNESSSIENEDLSNVINNGSLYVSYKGDTYYREYNDKNYEAGAIWGAYAYRINSAKNMMRIDSSDEKEVLFEDTGTGNIYIYNDRFFLQDRRTDNDSGIIYSVRLDGDDREEYISGRILDFDVDRGIMIVSDEKNSIHGIQVDSGETYFITDDLFLAYDATDGILYTQRHDSNMPMTQIMLTSVHIDGSNMLTLAVTSADLYSEWATDHYSTAIQKIQIFDDYIFFSYGAHAGTAIIYQGGRIARVKKDGSDYEDLVGREEKYVNSDFLVKEDNSRKYLIYDAFEEADMSSTAKMLDIDNRTITETSLWARSIGEPFLVDKEVHLYTETNGELVELLNASELASLGITGDFDYGETSYQRLTNIEYDGMFVYFTYDTGIRDETLDLGWRSGYTWEKIMVYRKNLKTGNIDIVSQIEDRQTLWNEQKAAELRAFMASWGDIMGQEYEEYTPERNVSFYGLPLPEGILEKRMVPAIDNQEIAISWSEDGESGSDYKIVAVYSNAETADYLECYCYLFTIHNGNPVVLVTSQNQGGLPGNHIVFSETENQMLKDGYSNIIKMNK